MTGRIWLLAVAVGCFVLGTLVPRPGSAYKRTQTCGDTYLDFPCDEGQRPKPLYWPVRCVKYRISQNGSPSSPLQSDDELSDRLEELVIRSFQTWNEPRCSDFQAKFDGRTPIDSANYDQDGGWEGNENVISWRADRWPYDSRWAFALTSVTYNANTGEIADADTEFNSANYNFDHFEKSQVNETERVDFLNTLTHEAGHFLGLDHPENEEEATMWGSAPPGEIEKRVLSQDDVNGLCAIYPVEGERTTCDSPEDFQPPDPDSNGNGRRDGPQPGTCFCSASPSSLPAGFGLVVLYGLLLASHRWRSGDSMGRPSG